MKEQNISIYLRKENYEKYKKLTDIMNIPLSSFLAQSLQDANSMAVVDRMILLAQEAKEAHTNGKK